MVGDLLESSYPSGQSSDFLLKAIKPISFSFVTKSWKGSLKQASHDFDANFREFLERALEVAFVFLGMIQLLEELFDYSYFLQFEALSVNSDPPESKVNAHGNLLSRNWKYGVSRSSSFWRTGWYGKTVFFRWSYSSFSEVFSPWFLNVSFFQPFYIFERIHGIMDNVFIVYECIGKNQRFSQINQTLRRAWIIEWEEFFRSYIQAVGELED